MYGLNYGYGNSSAMGTVSVVGLLLAITGFVFSIVLYRKFVGAGRSDFSKESWSWERFFGFDSLIISGALKYLYILSAIETAVIAIMVVVLATAVGGAIGLIVGIILGALCLALLEFLCRVWFEFTMLTVVLTQNSTSIRDYLANRSSGSTGDGFVSRNVAPVSFSGGLRQEPAATAAQQRPAAYAVQQPAESMVSRQTTGQVDSMPWQQPVVSSPTATSFGETSSWVCSNCGKVNTKGTYCGICGAPRS